MTDFVIFQKAIETGSLSIAHEIRLKYFAKTLAKVLSNTNIGMEIKSEIGKKFDGDFDVLWSTIKDKPLDNQRLIRDEVEDALKNTTPIFNSMSEIEQVPLLQVSLPVNFDDWDGQSPILVAYQPISTDDTEWDTIEAFDHLGNTIVLDAKVAPEFPVLVVGINERGGIATNPSGAQFAPPIDDPCEEDPDCDPGGGGGGGSFPYYIFIETIDLDKHPSEYEPWIKGVAELYFRVYQTGAAAQNQKTAANIGNALGIWTPTGAYWYIDYDPWAWGSPNMPERTIHHSTGWEPDVIDILLDATLVVMEYDPIERDGGYSNHDYCDYRAEAPTIIAAITYIDGKEIYSYDDKVYVDFLQNTGHHSYWLQPGQNNNSISENDDEIGSQGGFQSAVADANSNRGSLISFGNSAFTIKIKVVQL